MPLEKFCSILQILESVFGSAELCFQEIEWMIILFIALRYCGIIYQLEDEIWLGIMRVISEVQGIFLLDLDLTFLTGRSG